MKMHSRRKNRSPWRWLVIVIILLICIFAGKTIVSVVGPIGNGVLFASKYVQDKVFDLKQYFVSKKELQEEVEILRREVGELQNDKLWYSALEAQHEAILKNINRADKASSSISTRKPHTVASVTMRPPFSAFDIITIDAGEVEGVTVGAWVSWQGFVLGQVSEVKKNSSQVKLLSSPDSNFTVRVREVDAQVYGLGGGRYKVELPKGSTVAVGDPVTMPNLQVDIVGAIETIDDDQSGAFVEAYFNIPILFHHLQYVDVL